MNRRHRETFFMHNGPGPWPCFWCGVLVEYENVSVHHQDGDHTNDDPSNLVASHRPCHTQHHLADDSRREQIRALGRQRRKLTDVEVEQIKREYVPGVVRQVDLAAKYGTFQTVISRVVRGEGSYA